MDLHRLPHAFAFFLDVFVVKHGYGGPSLFDELRRNPPVV